MLMSEVQETNQQTQEDKMAIPKPTHKPVRKPDPKKPGPCPR